MFWLIRKWLKKREEIEKDPICCDVKANFNELVSVLKTKGYQVDVYKITDLGSFLHALTTGIDGVILENYKGEDLTAVRTYTEKPKARIEEEVEDGLKVQKRLHLRFWKIRNDVYLVKAHTEFDVTDPRHVLGEGINFEQGCEWFRKDAEDSGIKIL
jgi:hypothetical protein